MSIEEELKKEGIEIQSEIDANVANSISKNVTRRIIESFPDLDLNENEIYNKLAKLKMYKAKIPNGMVEASYSFKFKSIYFNENIDDEDLEEFAIHECIHYLQERLDTKNRLQRMGLCNYINSKPYGLSINEAAVQYTASHIIGVEPDFEKYYNISLYTPSPSYYPLECALLNEIIYFTGTSNLFKSTLYTTNDFKKNVIDLTSEDTYDILVTNFDKLLSLEEEVVCLTEQMNSLEDVNSKFKKLSENLEKTKQKVADMFFSIQNVIIEDFFEYEFKRVNSLEDLEKLRHKINNFTDIVGKADGYTFYDDFYLEFMNKLEHKCNILENGGTETALMFNLGNNSPFSWIHKLFNFIFKKREKI